jgi:FtsP/CotA-like multicopper oxidase with cupredoxin domain
LASTNGVLEATLTIATGMVPYGDGSRWALTVNGTSPGPTLRARPGDVLRLTLDNHMDHATSLHTHGLHVSPSGNSDNPFLMIEPGQRFSYEIAIPAEHPGGLFWYHSHLHHHSAEQVFAGFIGAIVVEDEFDRRADVAGARERLLVIHDARTGGTEAAVLGTSMMDQMTGREGNVVLVNGQLRPNLETVSGGLERWRIVNASASRFYRLSLAGHQLKVVGGDGGRLATAIAADSLSLVPGERAELFVQPAAAGTYTMGTAAVDRGSGMMGMGGGMMGGGTSGASVCAASVAGRVLASLSEAMVRSRSRCQMSAGNAGSASWRAASRAARNCQASPAESKTCGSHGRSGAGRSR